MKLLEEIMQKDGDVYETWFKKSTCNWWAKIAEASISISISEMIEDPLSIKIHFQGARKETAFWHVLLLSVTWFSWL